jgi:hypothetical protein
VWQVDGKNPASLKIGLNLRTKYYERRNPLKLFKLVQETMLIVILVISIAAPNIVFATDEKEQNIIPYRIIPESELTHIVIAEDWILKNDEDPDAGNVKISFPERWVTESPANPLDTKTVTLRVPYWLLTDNDMNEKSDEITVYFPNKYFIGMKIPALPPTPDFDKKSLYDSLEKTSYQERWWYTHSGASITGARGYCVPYSYTNPYAETFIALHEIEFYGNTGNDAVEIVVGFGSSITNTRVGFAIWVNNVQYTSQQVYCSPGDQVYYEFCTNGSYYNCLIIDADNTWYYFNTVQDTTMPTDFWSVTPSAELDDLGGFVDNFLVTTSPISITNLKTTYWQYPSYAQSVLSFSSSNNANYVSVSATLSSSGFYTYQYAGY